MTPELEKLLRTCTRLPSLPTVAVRILELAQLPEDDETDISAELIGLVQGDVALSAQLLKAANSPLFRGRAGVASVAAAVRRLGENTTLTLALGFAVIRAVEASRGLDLERYWLRSLICALGARALARRVETDAVDEVFLGGLLSDIGMLALDAALEDYGAGGEDHDALVAWERERLGADHAEVGSW